MRKSPEQRKSEVFEACDTLAAEGQNVTVAAIRERVGGGNSSALKYMREWKAGRNKPQGEVDPILARGYERMREEIEGAVQERLEAAEAARERAEDRAAVAEKAAAEATARAQAAEQAAERARARQDKAEADTAEHQARADELKHAVAGERKSMEKARADLRDTVKAIKEISGANNHAHIKTLSHVADIKKSLEAMRQALPGEVKELRQQLAKLEEAQAAQAENQRAAIEMVSTTQQAAEQSIKAAIEQQDGRIGALVDTVEALKTGQRPILEAVVKASREELEQAILLPVEAISEAQLETNRRLNELESAVRKRKAPKDKE